MSITELMLGSAPLTNYNQISRLTNLKRLYLSESIFKDMSVLKNLTNITTLNLEECQI